MSGQSGVKWLRPLLQHRRLWTESGEVFAKTASQFNAYLPPTLLPSLHWFHPETISSVRPPCEYLPSSQGTETYKSNQAWSGEVNPKMWFWICIAHQLEDKEDHMGEGRSPTSLCHPATINFQKHLKIDTKDSSAKNVLTGSFR